MFIEAHSTQPPSIHLSERDFPDLNPEALACLPNAVRVAERLARQWNLAIEGPMPGATCSLVLAAGAFVLKIPLLEWGHAASNVLSAFAPHGGVAVLREDPESGAVLLARVRPGEPLDTLEEDAAIATWIALVRRLRNADGHASSAETYLDPLWKQPTSLIFTTDVRAVARRLVETAPAPRLLHGDLHHFNILRLGDGWVTIDPEGLVGDPAYECAAFMRNPAPAIGDHPDLPGLLRRRIAKMAEGLGDPPERLWGWAFVRTALCVWNEQNAFGGAWLKVAYALDTLAPEFMESYSRT